MSCNDQMNRWIDVCLSADPRWDQRELKLAETTEEDKKKKSSNGNNRR